MPGITTLNMFFYAYILKSLKDGNKYVGYTNNLRKRITEHNKGISFSTRSRRPLKLIYFEACLDEEDARRREKYLKTTGGRRFIAKRLRSYFLNNLKL